MTANLKAPLKHKKNGPKHRSATDAELEYIKANYGTMSAREIGIQLDRSRPAIEHIIHRMGIKRSTDQRKFDTKGSSYGKLFAQYKSSAKKRKYDFDLTKEEFTGLAQLNCTYCNSGPILKNPWEAASHHASRRFKATAFILVNGIDRVDNTLGYIKGNCVPCCSVCNHMKCDLTHTEFVAHIEKIFCKHNNADHLIDCSPKDSK